MPLLSLSRSEGIGKGGLSASSGKGREEAARGMLGMRSSNRIDRHNFLVRVNGAELRSQQTIDALCLRLEPLGDALAVVVHVQNAAATTRDQMDPLNRNCRLAPVIGRRWRRCGKCDVA